jgi:serine/threonine protein kinase
VHQLPLDDQQWLADGDVHVLVPLRSGEGLIGTLVLGEKLNDLPFSRDDQAQLAPVAAALALKIENVRLREAPDGSAGAGADLRIEAAEDQPAVVCARCAFIAAAGSDRCSRCGGEVAPSQLPALLAGKFRLERELGRGGMGVVYLAFDTALERPVAIKTLPRVSMAESVRLRREARAMAAFAHPHLALVFGLESWRGSPALVMEYLEGGTLADRLRRSRMAPGEVVVMAHDLAGAIALIHDGGLLHRDIKPSNIAFTRAGQPKLLDFGLAQIFVAAQPREPRPRTVRDPGTWMAGADVTTVDHFGQFAGTPAYMAPEAVGGEFLDGAADLWSFGVVLFECLTGERPFAGRPIDAVGVGWTREIQARAPDCPPELAELVGDLLAPDKRKRPASAHVVRKRLLDQATLRVA